MKNDNKRIGVLTTHVLDTSRGCPAEGIKISLYSVSLDYNFELIGSGQTNSDGRLENALLSGSDFCEGTYQLVFHISEYMKSNFVDQFNGLFLEDIPIRFNILNRREHYHVPLLLSPFGYSTYRGS